MVDGRGPLGGRAARDGSTVHLRQIQPDDADRHRRDALAGSPSAPATCATSRRTRASRTATWTGSSTSTTATGRRSWWSRASGSWRVGRYERLGPDAPDAEVAFVVEDAHQGRGIGSVLLEHLAEAAREDGITRFVAEVLPENGGMLRVFTDVGYQVQRQYADGVVHLSFPIAPTEQSLRGAVGTRAAHRGRARSPGCSPRAGSPSTAPAPPARGSARPCSATCATAASPGRSYPVHPQRDRRSAGCRRTRRRPTPATGRPRGRRGAAGGGARRGGRRGRAPACTAWSWSRPGSPRPVRPAPPRSAS